MLHKIISDLKNFPEDACYEVSGKEYRNKDLYKYVCNIYHYILENNKDKKGVIVYGHKDIYMIASFIACSCAGVAYVPVDISIPKDRREIIINKINPNVIIDKKIEKVMQREYYKDIYNIYMKDNDIYYIIFTSGSTGEPKGVQITYANVKSCIKWLKQICNIEKGVILNQANYSFDLSVADIYLSLCTRSKHFVIEREVQKDFTRLFNELKKSKSDLAVFTPSFLNLLLTDKSFNEELMPNLKTILLCGENLSENTVSRLFERFPNINLINSYGPTECTFAVTSIRIEDLQDISIGIPKDGTEIFIIDDEFNEVVEGKTGEILITGESVGNGYIGNIKQNDNFVVYNGKKGYRTGDIGYYKNGKYYCIGRKDSQIKYKGYRIELLDIESTIDKLEFVEKSVVTVKKSDSGIVERIIAFVKLRQELSTKEIKVELKRLLPEYMIPMIRIIDNIPLSQNGKIDAKKLLEDYNKWKNRLLI